MNGPVTVRELVGVLRQWQPRLLAGEAGLGRPVSWASTMRARLPAFEGFSGGELALCSLGTLRALRAQVYELTLPAVVEQLAEIGVSAIAVGGLTEGQALPPPEARALDEAQARADALAIALIALPSPALAEVQQEVIAHIIARREQQPAPSEPPDVYAARLRASLRGEALETLLTGTYASEATMRVRAGQLGYDLTQPHAVLWIELALDAAGPHDRAAQLAETLSVGLGAWTSARPTEVVALVPIPHPRDASPTSPGRHDFAPDVLDHIQTLLRRGLGEGVSAGDTTWSAGLGAVATAPGEVHRSATEAREAARLGRALRGARHIARPADLGVYQLLLALRESGHLAPFVRRTLAPLQADTRTGDALVETLEAFFDCNGNLSEAARHLHLHRNSLIYRLNRARELLGHDLDDPDLRLSLQLAIKAQRVLEL